MPGKHAQSIEEIFPLIDFCRHGRLEEARQWAESGKPLDPPLNTRRYSKRVPLLIAIDKEFFSLASLLLQHGAEGLGLDDALEYAIYRDRPEIVKLLLDSKAVARDAIEFSTVCDHGNPAIIKLFIEHGADLVEGLPIYNALVNHPLVMARPVKELLGVHPEVQAQLDSALLHHANDGSGKVIGMLIWAGARPHVRIKDPRDPDDETGECAIEAAARRGDVAILKQMRPDRHPDLISSLLKALFRNNIPMLEYLLSLGAVINDKPNGGSSLVDGAFWCLWFPHGDSARNLPEWITCLGSKGARWIPDNEKSIGDARRNFHRAPSELCFQVIKALVTSGVGQVDQIKELIRTPKMHDVLGGGRLRDIDLLLDPPKPKPPEPEPAAKRPGRKKQTIVFVLEEAEPRARTWLLDQLCEDPAIRFWTPSVTSNLTQEAMRKLLGIDEDSKRDPVPFFEHAVRWGQKHLTSVKLQDSTEDGALKLEFDLVNGAEWKDALGEVWSLKGEATPHYLTSAGSKLLAWASNPKTAKEPIKEISLSHKLGMNGRLGHIDDLVHEIAAKAGMQIMGETKGSRWQRGGAIYRFTAPKRRELPAGGSLDLTFDAECLAEQTKNLRPYRRQIEDALLKAKPTGDSLIYLFRADTRVAVHRIFPSFKKRSEGLGRFFSNLKLPHTLKLYYDFQTHAPIWYAAVEPASTWKETLREIQESIDRPPPSKLWGISESASTLLQALLELRTAEHSKRWVVRLSKEMCEEMGLDPKWLDSDYPTWMAVFAEEISEMTSYRVTAHPLSGSHWRGPDVCLHCRTKPEAG